MLRILHISTRLILGGSQENTILSCEGQARMGHEVHLAFGPIYGPEGSLLQRVEHFNAAAPTPASRITTHLVPHLTREVSPLADWRCYRELRALVRTLQPDIVHTHSSKAGILGRLAAWDEYQRDLRIDPIPAQHLHCWRCVVIHTIHGPPFMPVNADSGLVARLKNRANNKIYTLAERFAARKCDAIVSVADAMTHEFLRRGIGKPARYTTIPSGMETERFLHAAPGEHRATVRRELGLAESDFVIGTVARLAQHKGHDDILEALADDLRAHPDWKLLWVGDGWWKDRLLERAESIGAAKSQIITTGLVPPERVPALIRAMDVLVHPSYREGLPRTVPQAQLCAVMPIAYDCDGTPEAIVPQTLDGPINPDSTGILVPTGDRARLREAIRWAAGHAHERRAIGERARVVAAERFSTVAMVESLDRLYNRLLNHK